MGGFFGESDTTFVRLWAVFFGAPCCEELLEDKNCLSREKIRGGTHEGAFGTQ